ncbi:ABC transporter substrate-binding protein [Thiomicrospira microaerophila]|uniref:ABC transporter substrate-binding protein n=1 Tax=Thiomicrospira microaerophila TaxID=406020 RepID=UPI00200E7E3A|nr:ABC transporter substrate-binding protein [Thiomicrospira microaerophila]UQB43334.1 ABC transporter substrate-binding protein [Thiomicrospira microaerophila]
MVQPFTRRSFFKLGAGGVVLPALLSGCQSVDYSQAILVGVTSRPRMLDPRRATDALSSRVNRLIYHQLIDFNEASEPIADLADWQQLSAKHYRFTLQKTPIFHHGKPLVAEDVAATYQSVLDTEFGSPHRGTLNHIEKIEVINTNQVDFFLSKEDALFVGRLTLGILPADLIAQQHNFAAKPIGSGAARFVSLNEQRLILLRPDQVELHFVVVKDPMVRVLKLKKGELDCVQNDLSPELVNYCTRQPEFNVSWQKGTNYAYIGFNLEDPWLAQPALRQAIAQGIDRQQVIDAMFQGQARLAGGLLPPEHWAGNPSLTGWSSNPDKAIDLLKKLDRPLAQRNQPIRLSFKTSSDPTRIRLATLYQAQLKPLGIDLQVQSYDWGTFYNDIVQGRFQLFSLAWVGIKSPDIFQYVFASDAMPPKGANRGRYQSQQADQLIKLAGQTQDLEEQATLYRQLQAHLQAELPIMPLWFENQYAVVRKNLLGYQLFADGRLDSLLTVIKKV